VILIGKFAIDAALSESHDKQADITEFPIEDGSTLTDHVIVRPRQYRVQGIVSNNPVGEGFRVIEDDGSVLVLEDTPLAEQARVALEEMLAARQPLRVVTAKCTYDNMVMQSLSFSDGAENGDALIFDASFKQIDVRQNRRSTVEIKFRAVDRGRQVTRPPGWIGTDAQGRNVLATKAGPGVESTYFRADGSKVSPEEAAAAARRNDAVLVKYDKNGNAMPVDQQDYQPFTPKQKKPFWAPNQRKGKT
jgi:hypothetical protein